MNYVISITKPEAMPVLEELCRQLSLPISVTLHGRGTATGSMLELLGIESSEKHIMLSVATPEKTSALIAEQRRHLHLGVPGHGIVIVIPIKSIGGGRTMALMRGNETGGAKCTPPVGFSHELIVIIAGKGQTDLVMNAAREAGARGGTVIHGKGTGGGEPQKFHNISIAQEKEVILIVSSVEHKADIMRAVLMKAGPGTEAGAIVFSLPATAVAGFGFPENGE